MEQIKINGHDDALIGESLIWRNKRLALVYVYSGHLILEKLMERDGMTDEEALEFIGVNIEGCYSGINTPVVVWSIE